MKNNKKSMLTMVAVLFLLHTSVFSQNNIVEKYGQLSVKGNYLMGQYGDTVQLRGMSLFWSQWMGQYYTPEAVKWLKDDWKCTVVRAAMGVDMGGYMEHPEVEKAKVIAVVDAAIAEGIYVIIDYHSHEAHKNTEAAQKFFAEMAQKYGKYPNVIYEIYNEPLQNISWATDIKPYSEAVIKSIREQDADNIVICGTRQWSQLVNEAALDPIKDANTVYSLHFYAFTHRKWLRDEAKKAMANGICLFISEYGTCDASGNGHFDPIHTKEWFDFMDQYKISGCNWSIADKVETASALHPGASGKGGWTKDQITPSGELVKAEISKNIPLLIKKKEKKTTKTKTVTKTKTQK